MKFLSGARAVQSELVELRESIGDPRHLCDSAEIAQGRIETRNRLEVGRCLIVAFIRVMRGRLRIDRQLPAPAGTEGLTVVLQATS